jgi:hypothetical protein
LRKEKSATTGTVLLFDRRNSRLSGAFTGEEHAPGTPRLSFFTALSPVANSNKLSGMLSQEAKKSD